MNRLVENEGYFGLMNPYSSYKDSEVEWIWKEIPSHWKLKKHRFIFERKIDVENLDGEILPLSIVKYKRRFLQFKEKMDLWEYHCF